MAGLSVSKGLPSKKTTALVTNHLGIACTFSELQCDHHHEHVPLENGLPARARTFGAKMIAHFVRALKLLPCPSLINFLGEEEDDLEEELDREIEAAPNRAMPPRRERRERITEAEKSKVNQVHVNLGHITRSQMLSLFKAAGAKDRIMQYVKDEYSCSQCMRQRKPIDRKKAAMPRTFSFNRHVGIDVFYISWKGVTHAFLNMICHGTNYQQVAWLKGCEAGTPPSKLVWQTFLQNWIKPYGSPEVVMSDGGSEFKDSFERALEQFGVLQVISDASSPWQNAKVERHGGWVKERAEQELSSGQCVVTSSEELDELLSYVVCHKNRWFSRGGFSPCQLVFGCNPNIPAELLGDSPQDLAWQDIEADIFDQDTAASAFSRSHRIRQRARELCIQESSTNKIRLSSKGRLHKQRQWAIGQWVYVWRRTAGTGGGHVTRARWTGPGIVVLQTRHTVYVSMRVRLWKCNSDQLRAASHYESIGAALSDTKEMQEILEHSRAGRCGAVDVAAEGSPPADSEEQQVPQAEPQAVPRHRPLPPIAEEEAVEPEGPERPGPGMGQLLRQVEQGVQDVRAAPENPNPSEMPSRARMVSQEEPLEEPAPIEKKRRTSISTGSSGLSTPRSGKVKRQVDQIERIVRSSASSSATRMENEIARELQKFERDRKLARKEVAASSTTPPDAASQASDQPPEPVEAVRDAPEEDDAELLSYPGLEHTSFLQLTVKKEEFKVKGIKPRNSEFNMGDATSEELEGFKKSDLSEWQSIVDFGAVKVVSEKEALKIRESQPHRILASRIVRRKKPMPGIGNFKYKSRWCVLGHGDPDSGTYKTFSPMPSTEAISLFFQLALCLGLGMAFADVKSAFCQSDVLNRPQGPLYAEVCSGLGLSPKCLIQLVAPVYGLDDAPIRWHHTVLEFLLSLGFERSLFEPCWLVKKREGKIIAMMLLEVDDFNIATTEDYRDELHNQLNERFVFGKWEFGSADFAGRTVTFHDDKVTMTQEKYIVEKLHQIKVPRGMLSNKEAPLTPDLFEEYRSMLYRVSWLAHQTRPEAAGIVSLLSSRLNKASVHDLSCLNKLVHHIKNTANQPLVLHKFDLDKMILIAASDAGGVGSKPVSAELSSEELEDTVQGAWVILASDRMPSANHKAKVSILSWRSSKLKRRVSSTLAGEALAFSQALSEVEWLQLMIRDVLHGDVHREDWRKSIVPFIAVLKDDCKLKGQLQQCHITDAKSLYDAISKDSGASRQDRRTAIEIAIILDGLRRSNSTVRWAPHPRMIADVLTKDNIAKSNGALEEVLRTGRISLWEEEEELQKRKENPVFKLRSKKASERLRQDASYLLTLGSLSNKDFGELFQMFHHAFTCDD